MQTSQRILDIARAEIGVKERKNGENPRILEYFRATNLFTSADETPWCAAFVNWVLAQAGINGTGSTLARSFAAWKIGKEVPLYAAEPGDIVVLHREKPHPTFGHVGFLIEKNLPVDSIQLLGGNQSNSVSIAPYPVRRIITIRRPPMTTTTTTPTTAATPVEKFGITASKQALSDIVAVAFAVADGIQPSDIAEVPRLISIVGAVPTVIQEASDYSPRELEELGRHFLAETVKRVRV